MKSLILLSLSCLLSFTGDKLYAVDVAWDGYARTRMNYFYNLDLNRDESPNTRAYTDMRFRLNPSFYVTDKFRVLSSLNLLDGNLGDNPLHSGPYTNPAQSQNRVLNYNESESTLGKSISSLSSSSRGGIYVPDAMVETTDLTPLQVRRVWMEFDSDFGTLKVGRMPFQLGMGIFANAGDDVDQEVGSTRDRIEFDTAMGPYYIRPGLGWTHEGGLDYGADDVLDFYFYFGRKMDAQDISMYLSYTNQSNYRSSDIDTTSPYYNRGSHFWTFDFYLQNQFSWANLMAEVMLMSGNIAGHDLLAINAAGRAEWAPKQWKILTELGFSSGTDSGDAAAGDIKSVPFNRDYNVAMILFEEALPGGPSLKKSSGTADSTPTAPHSGAISNAIYARAKFSYEVASFFNPQVNLVVPYAHRNPIGGTGKLYGLEYDLITLWPFGRYFTGELSFAHFIPMDYYDDFSSTKNHSALLLRAGLSAKF